MGFPQHLASDYDNTSTQTWTIPRPQNPFDVYNATHPSTTSPANLATGRNNMLDRSLASIPHITYPAMPTSFDPRPSASFSSPLMLPATQNAGQFMDRSSQTSLLSSPWPWQVPPVWSGPAPTPPQSIQPSQPSSQPSIQGQPYTFQLPLLPEAAQLQERYAALSSNSTAAPHVGVAQSAYTSTQAPGSSTPGSTGFQSNPPLNAPGRSFTEYTQKGRRPQVKPKPKKGMTLRLGYHGGK